MRGRTPAPATSPIAQTLERLSATGTADVGVEFSAHPRVPDEPGWTTVAGLASDPELLAAILERIARAYETDNRPFAGTTFLRGYLWRMLAPAVAAFLTERRLPDLRAENVALRLGGDGSVQEVAFPGARFRVLADDPAASHPDAAVSPSEEELLLSLRDALAETHLAAVIPALRSLRVRRGTRALGRVFADSCAEAFMFVGRGLGVEAEGRDFAGQMLSGASPLSAPTNYYVLEYPGGSEVTRVRHTCCLYYKTGKGTCFTCPRKTDEERTREILEARGEALEVEET